MGHETPVNVTPDRKSCIMFDKRQQLREKLSLVSSEQRMVVMEERLRRIEDHMRIVAEAIHAQKKLKNKTW
jgi:hypothetical protein